MYKILALLLFLLPVFAQGQTCVVSGNISDYSTAGLKWSVTLKEVRRAGYIMPVRDIPVLVANNGAFRFTVPQTIGTDTTKVRIYISDSRYEGEGKQGVWFAIPHGATASLATLVPETFIAPSHVIAVPVLALVDSTSGVTYRADSLRLGSGATVIAPTNGGDTPTLQVIATGGTYGDSIKVAHDIANGKGDADSVKLAFDRLGDRADADSVFLKADSTSLHAQKFAVTNDLIAGLSDADSVSLQVALIKNIIAALADADSVKLAFDRLGDRENADSTLIKISLSLDSALTLAERALSSAKRIFSVQDSVTLTVAPNETIDLSTGNNFRLTLTASDTLGFTGGVDGQVIQVVVTNANNFTLTWSGVAWPGGTAPTLTAVANKRSIFSFILSGGMIHGVSVLNY